MTDSQKSILAFLKRMRAAQFNAKKACMCCNSLSGCWYTPDLIRSKMTDRRQTAGGIGRSLKILVQQGRVETRQNGTTTRGFPRMEYRATIV